MNTSPRLSPPRSAPTDTHLPAPARAGGASRCPAHRRAAAAGPVLAGGSAWSPVPVCAAAVGEGHVLYVADPWLTAAGRNCVPPKLQSAVSWYFLECDLVWNDSLYREKLKGGARLGAAQHARSLWTSRGKRTRRLGALRPEPRRQQVSPGRAREGAPRSGPASPASST